MLRLDLLYTGGVDQRKIFTFAEQFLPQIGYAKRIHLMNPMVPGLTGTKMSSSEVNSKIDLLDPASKIKTKIKGAFCEEGNVEGNGLLAFVKMVLYPMREKGFTIHRKEEHGGNQYFPTYVELEAAYLRREVHPKDLKDNVTNSINELLDPIRQRFTDPKLIEIVERAYPVEKKVPYKKEKKVKPPKPTAVASPTSEANTATPSEAVAAEGTANDATSSPSP